MNEAANNRNNETIIDRIRQAVNNIKTMLPTYWEATVKSRTPGSSNGSVFSFEDVEKVLFEDRVGDWVPFPECPNLLPGCTAFKLCNIPGHLGIINLEVLDGSVMLDVVDNKKTGKAKCLLVNGTKGPETDYATLILGEDGGKEVVFTFHPGNPIRPDEIPVEKLKGRTKLSVSEAIKFGFTHACIA